MKTVVVTLYKLLLVIEVMSSSQALYIKALEHILIESGIMIRV